MTQIWVFTFVSTFAFLHPIQTGKTDFGVNIPKMIPKVYKEKRR